MTPETSSLADLPSRIRAGDREAERELALYFYPRILGLVFHRRRDGQSAADLTQQTLVYAVEALRAGRLDDKDKLAAYVYGIARHLVARCSRRRAPLALGAPDTLPSPSDLPDLSAYKHERAGLLEDSIASLTDRDREILHLTFVEDLAASDIAARLSLSPEAVRQRKSRAVARLRHIFHQATTR